MRLTNFSIQLSSSIWLRELAIFSGLSLAPLKNIGSWDVHYLGNPITPSGPIQSFHLGNPLPPWTQNLPHGPCNYFAAKALNPSTHHLANIFTYNNYQVAFCKCNRGLPRRLYVGQQLWCVLLGSLDGEVFTSSFFGLMRFPLNSSPKREGS